MNKNMKNGITNYAITLAAGIGVSVASTTLLAKAIPSKNIAVEIGKVLVASALSTAVMSKVDEKLNQ